MNSLVKKKHDFYFKMKIFLHNKGVEGVGRLVKNKESKNTKKYQLVTRKNRYYTKLASSATSIFVLKIEYIILELIYSRARGKIFISHKKKKKKNGFKGEK